MASKPEKYVSASGRVTWRVKWRSNGRPQTVTVDNYQDAKALRRVVEERRHMVLASAPEVRDLSIIGRHKASPLPESRTGPTWREVSQAWLRDRTGLEGVTERDYATVLRDHLSVWDDRPIDSLGQSDVVALVKAHGITNKSTGYGIWIVLRAVFRYAVQKRAVLDNPSDGVKLKPKPTEGPAVFLTDKQVRTLLDTAETLYGAWFVLCLRLALEAGLRQSEVMGLQCHDLIAGPALHIRRAQRPLRGSGAHSKNTKNNRDRVVAISDGLAEAITDHVAGRSGASPVLTRRDANGLPLDAALPLTSRMVTHRWERVRRHAGLEDVGPRFHDLRHTHASDLLDRGVSMEDVCDRLGHGDIKITYDFYRTRGPQGDERMRRALRGMSRK